MSDRRSDQAGDGAFVCYCVCLADVSKDCDAHRGIESEVTVTSQGEPGFATVCSPFFTPGMGVPWLPPPVCHLADTWFNRFTTTFSGRLVC